jgi:N-acetylmuramoyl-L-alanine amidase CwlD
MNRLRVKAGSAVALAVLSACIALPARAQTSSNSSDFWFAGTRLIFGHVEQRGGQVAVATDDPALATFLAKVGAVLSYQAGQSYIVVTTADRRVISFTLGNSRFNVAGVDQSAAFPPYAQGDVAYVPFLDLARALYVDPVMDGATTILQPQIAALEVRPADGRTLVTLRGATPLQFKRTSGPDDDDVSLVFSGTASTLEPLRRVDAAGLRIVTIAVGGSPRNPTTTVDFEAAPGTLHVLAPADSPNAIALAFAPAGSQLTGPAIPAAGRVPAVSVPAEQSVAPRTDSEATSAPYGTDQSGALGIPPAVAPVAPVAPAETPTPTAYGLAPATITSFDTQSTSGGFEVHLAISGNVTYEFHRLSDNRWYVDFKPAVLDVASEDQPLDDPSVLSVRLKPFVGPIDRLPTVRLGLTLASPRAVSLVPTSNGLTISVATQDDPDAQTFGTGELLPGRLYTGIVPLPAPAAAPGEPTAAQNDWKFGRVSTAANPRLIVIDPGHGGSDDGAMHNGLVEKELNLDMAKRLRAILIGKGWQVKMTRDTDVDVFAPNDSARDELQARCDVANRAGARLFVSIHTNSFTSADQDGTTTYYYKADSYGLAEAVHARLAASLPTSDDGIRKDNFYVIHHSKMPAILVETAFLSNPADAALLRSGSFLQKIAAGIADGIGDFTGGPPDSNANASSDGS